MLNGQRRARMRGRLIFMMRRMNHEDHQHEENDNPGNDSAQFGR